tara:strand:+ start:1031 stop:1270 length:240 start_codon:yes stop_codon:yes gene_type:complete
VDELIINVNVFPLRCELFKVNPGQLLAVGINLSKFLNTFENLLGEPVPLGSWSFKIPSIGMHISLHARAFNVVLKFNGC